jgi:predicted SAM-dependent methyltransferase
VTPWRRIPDHWRVRGLVGRVVRNRKLFLRPRRLESQYLDLGCGPNLHAGFINADYSWRPGIDICWDFGRGLPLATASLQGIFSEHCLEHFSLENADAILAECKRVLRPGGVIRIVVPDAELYLGLYAERQAGTTEVRFPYEADESFAGTYTPLLSVNRVFYVRRDSPAGHWCMFDFALLRMLLEGHGFRDVVKRSFQTGGDPNLLVDNADRASESLYVEATA